MCGQEPCKHERTDALVAVQAERDAARAEGTRLATLLLVYETEIERLMVIIDGSDLVPAHCLACDDADCIGSDPEPEHPTALSDAANRRAL